MLDRLKGSDETLIHTCPEGRGNPPVYRHDVKTYMLIDEKTVDICYCPYCGRNIDKEAVNDD